jgi:hypothetical protein
MAIDLSKPSSGKLPTAPSEHTGGSLPGARKVRATLAAGPTPGSAVGPERGLAHRSVQIPVRYTDNYESLIY